MSSSTIAVYIRRAQGQQPDLIGHVNEMKLVNISLKAAEMLRSHTRTRPAGVKDNKFVVFSEPGTNREAATLVCKWIHEWDLKMPAKEQFLSLKTLGWPAKEPTFLEVVTLYQTMYSFHVPPGYRGDELRNEIWNYLHMAAVTLNEFIMLHECIPFDGGMIKTMIHQTMFYKVNGPVPGDIEAIEAYAKEVGLLEEMKAVEKIMEEQKASRAKMAAKAARDAAQGLHWLGL